MAICPSRTDCLAGCPIGPTSLPLEREEPIFQRTAPVYQASSVTNGDRVGGPFRPERDRDDLGYLMGNILASGTRDATQPTFWPAGTVKLCCVFSRI